MATACSIIENKIIQRLADKGLLDNNINTVEFLIDMFVTKEGINKIDDFLKDYNGSIEDKIESFIEDINSNTKIHGVANMLPTFKRYLNLIDNFQSIVNNSFNYNKTLLENLEALLDKYYSSTMRGNPIVNILSEVDNVKNITYNEGQQKALQKLSTFTDKYLDGKYSERNDYFTMIGKAGTGKTTVICQAVYDYIKKYFKKYGKLPSVTGIASSHKAKDILKQSMLSLTKIYDYEAINYNGTETRDGSIPLLSFNSIAEALNADVNSITNESLETEISSKINLHPMFPPKLASYDIVIVDECSMLSPVEFEAIQTLRKKGSILIFIGDSGQLMPIITDKNINDNLESYNRCKDNNITNAQVTEQFTVIRNENQVTCNTLSLAFNVKDSNSATLTEIMRSGDNHPLLQFADLFWNDNYKGDFTPETNINEYGALVTSKDINDVINKTADVFAQGIIEEDPNKIQYVAYTNNAVSNFNQKMHNIMRDRLGKQDVMGTPFFIGEPIYLASASKTGTKNNARGVIVSISDAKDAIDYDILRINSKDRFNAHRNNDLIKTNYRFKYFVITFKDEYGNLQKVNYVPDGDVEIDGKVYDNKTLFDEMRQGEYGGADKWVTTDILDREVEKPPYGKGSVNNDRFKYANATKSRTAASGFNDKIMHGYATTIHKAEGSTFENVIINYDDISGYKNHLGVNYKNLMYTGITRAKNTCIVVDGNYKYNLFGDSQNYTVSENGQNKQLTSVKDIIDYVNRNRRFSIKEDGVYTLDKLKMLSNEDELAYWNEENPWFKTVEDYYSSIKDKMKDTSATFGLVTQEMVGKLMSAAKKLVKDSPVITGNFNSDHKEAIGLYHKDSGTINLLPSFSNVEEMDGMSGAIHELLHLCSTYATEMSDIPLSEVDNEELKPIIDASAKLKAAFEIYKNATDLLIQNGTLNDYDAQQIEYSHTDLQEFIAELSNPYVIDAIKKVDQTFGKGIFDVIKDFIQIVVNHIKSIFKKSFSKESLKTSLTHYYNSNKEYEGLLDMVNDALNTLLDNPNSNLYKYNRAMHTIYENNKNILMHNKMKFPLAIENIYAEDKYVDINAKDFITRYGDFTEKGFNDKIRGIIVDFPFKNDNRIFYIDRIEVDSKSGGKKNIAQLFLKPIDINLGNEVLNVKYSGKNKVYKLKDINNPTIKVNKNELYLDYKRKERINYESEVEKEVKGILKHFNNFYSQYDINRFFLEYPFADSDILSDITDKLYDDKELTKDDYLKFKNNLGEHIEYPSSLSELGVEVVPNIENFATDKTKIKAYRINSVDSRNPQVAFENKVMVNPFASWYVEQERIKKEKGDISKEDEEEINKFKVQDQANFTQWLLTGDNSGNTAATKQLRDAYLSIIDNAANDRANNKVLYYNEVSPINSHAAAIQVIIDNWDKIKENVAPFNKYTSIAKNGETYKENGKELVFYRGFSASEFNTDWESTSQEAVDYANGIQGWVHSTNNEDTANIYADIHQEKDYLPTQVAEVKLKANARVRHFVDIQEYNKLYNNGEINIDEIDAIILDKGTTFGDKSELIARPSAIIASNVADKETDVWFGNGENDLLRSNPQFSNFGHGISLVDELFGQQDFKTVEGAYQAFKLNYADIPMSDKFELAERLANAEGAEARNIGRSEIKNLDTKKWDSESTDIMLSLMERSFNQNTNLRDELIHAHRKFTHKNADSKWSSLFPSLLQRIRNRVEFKKRYSKWINDTKKAGIDFSIPTYGESIPMSDANNPNVVFVFGTNQIGVNGILGKTQSEDIGGAAAFAQRYFGVEAHEQMDNSFSRNGKAYGLTTVTSPGAKRSLTREQITENIVKLYKTALRHPEKTFKVAYNNNDNQKSLNGYTGAQMKRMFWDAAIRFGSIPKNIQFSNKYAGIGMVSPEVFSSFELNYTNPIVGTSNVLQGFTIHSGGAIGSDSYFEEMAKKYGAEYKGYYIPAKRNPKKANSEVRIVNTEAELKALPDDVTGVLYDEAKRIVDFASESLDRDLTNLKKNNPDAYNLILRDYVQVAKSDKIVAVGKLLPNGTVDGSAGWAVEMARILNMSGVANRPIYVYNTLNDKWYKCSNDSSYGVYFFESSIPVLTKNTACIGTRGTEKVDNYVTDITQKQKEAIEQVFIKTAMTVADPSDWDSITSAEERKKIEKADELKKDASDIVRNPSKSTNTVDISKNSLGATEFNIRRLDADKLKIEEMGQSGEFTVRVSDNNELSKTLFNTFKSNNIAIGDLVRLQSKNNITILPVDDVVFNGDSIVIKYTNKQTINYSGKMMDISKQYVSNNVTSISDITQSKEIKHSIKQQLGVEIYANRIKYLSRRFRQFCQLYLKREIDGGNMEEDTTIAEFLQNKGLNDIKSKFLDTLNKSIIDENNKELVNSTIEKWAQKSINSGQFAENERNEAIEYQSSVFFRKNQANRQISENFDVFFKDSLTIFCRENDIVIDFYTAEVKKKDSNDDSQDNTDKDDTTVQDAEYETVEKWQVGETHAMQSASTRLKLFLSNIPERGIDGKIKLDDIGEPIFLESNRVYNELQTLMSDCFTLSDLMEKLDNMAKKSAIYNSINKLINSKNNKKLQTELFILLNNEEIKYENWYSAYTEKGSIKKFGLKHENTDKQSEDTYNIVNNNIKEGINFTGKEDSSNFFRLNQSRESIDKNYKNTGEIRTTINNQYLNVIKPFTSQGTQFSNLLKDRVNGLEDVSEYIEMLSNKNHPQHIVFENALQLLQNTLSSLGMNISREELEDNCRDTSNDAFPIVAIMDSLYNLINEFSNIYLPKNPKGDLNDYIKHTKGSSKLSNLCTLCPLKDDTANKQSVTYINGNNYPKFKALSPFGNTIKHIKDPNADRRNEWIKNEFKQYSWFYNDGNVIKTRNALASYIRTTSNQNDIDIINSIITGLDSLSTIKPEYRSARVEYINKQFSTLSDTAKGLLTDKNNPKDGIISEAQWNNDTIERLMTDRLVANKLERHRVVAFNGNDYFKWDAQDFTLMAFDKFYQYGDNSEFADFLMPIYSDAGVMEFVTLPKLKGIEGCLNSLLKSYQQELGRIKLVKERKRWRLDAVIAYNNIKLKKGTEGLTENQKLCYNDLMELERSGNQYQVTDCKYYSLPIQNLEDIETINITDYNSGTIELKTGKSGAGNYLNFFSFLYNYLGNNIDEQKIDLNKVREYIQKELLSEADKLQGIINDNKYGRYNAVSGRYESYVYSENKPELFNKILEFCYQNMCANIAITELTVTDLAQYKDAIDFQKRFKEVYAGTKRLNTTYDIETNPYAREDYVQIVLKDIFDTNRNKGNFEDLINSSDLPQSQKDWLIKTYGKINLTDAQSYRSLSSMRAVMSMNGEWKKSYDVIYDKIINGHKLTNKELMTFFQPRKPFVFTHKSVDAKNGNNSDKMKIGYQIKNSEFLLMYIYNNTNTLKGVNSAIIKGLNKFMEDNRIDCIHFNSGIKVGGQGTIDLDHPDLKPVLTVVRRDFKDNDSFIKECKKQLIKAQKEGKINTGYDIKILEGMLNSNIIEVYKKAFEEDQRKLQEKAESVLYYLTKIQKSTNDKETETDKLNRLKSANSEFVHIIPYSEYGIISSTPEHFLDKKQKLGTQLMRLLTSDNLGEYEINGKKLNGDETFRYLSQLLAAKAMLHHDKLNAVLSNDTQLLNYFLQQMQGNSKYSEATMSRIQSFNEQGKLNLLGDPLVKTQIESLINSFIRDEINDVKLDGGTCIQVTAAFADDLHIKYTNDEKGNRIEYWECRMPIALKELYNLAADKDGIISVDNIMKNPLIDKVTKEKLLQCIGCRVPTESKHSVQHLKCVEFLPSNAGSCIMLPYEITKTSGADFDIDKLYLWRPSFDIVTVESNGYKIKVPKYVEYKGTPIHKMNEKQLNNAIIDLFWSVLENPASAVQELYPNSYDMTQKAAYIGTLYHNKKYDARIRHEFQKKYPDKEYNAESKFNFLKNTDIDDLQSWYTTGLNRCSLMNQSYFFNLNSKGKGMLGIMAVNNVFLSLLQHTKVSIKDDYTVTINGRRPYKLYETTTSRNIDGNDIKVLSSLTLTEFLAAAPDSAKDPTLVFLGINNQNVNALVSAALLNYDIQDISLMFNHPVFKKLFEGTTSQTRLSVNDIAMKIIQMYTPKNDDGTYDYDKTNDYLKQIINYAPTGKTFKGKDGSDVPIRELQIKPANSNYDITQSDLLNSNNNINSEIRILSAFFRLYKIGQDLNNLAQVTRQDSTSGSNSATFAGDISKISKIQRIMLENKKGITALDGAGDLLDAYNISDDINIDDEDTRKSFIDRYGDRTQTPLGYIQAQLTFSLMNAVKYGKGRFPEFSPFLMESYRIMSSLSPYGYLNEDTIKRLSKEFIRYKLFQIPFFGSQEVNGVVIPVEQKMAIIINETWNDLNDIKYSYNLTNNKLLKSLTVNKYGVIVLPDSGQLLPDAKKEITDAWEELLNSPYDKVRMLGYNLIRYSFYRNGLSFAPDGFGHLCPDTRETIPGYVEAIESTYNQDDTGVSEFLTRFINNNARYLQSTKKRNLRTDQYTWINVSNKKNESDKDEDNNKEMNYAQENSEDIKKKYTYVVLGDSEHKDKYYNLSPAQIVPMTNLSEVTIKLKDGSTIQGEEVLSGTSDFTYYPSYSEELPFIIDKDSLEITKDLSNVVASLKTLSAIKDSNDIYDVLQELKDNNELTLTTNLC